MGVVVQPTGTVTLLFSDIEGSTRLLQRLGREHYAEALDLHRRLLRGAFARHGGYEVDCEGDAFFVAFARAEEAVAAAAEAQQALAAADWPHGELFRVRMGLHTGEPLPAPPKYVGLDVHQAARVMAAGHGGQVLVTEVTRRLCEQEPDRFAFRDLGEHRLKDLSGPQRLYQLLVDGLPAEFPALKTLGNRPTNLPVVATPFIGRERELEQVRQRLLSDGVRLLTLTGPGGTGKTRLALQAAADLVDVFSEGVLFVPLAPVSDPRLVIATIARTLGLREQPGEPLAETLAAYLDERELLLVLDNVEHLMEAAREVAGLLGRSERLTVLATSRSRLSVSGEHELPVPPLDLPVGDADPAVLGACDAVALFVARARAVRPEFRLDADNAAAVAEICRRLDGLPLALELAAARLNVLSPEALLRRLDHRLKLLARGARDADERQRTLRATIEWSYDLLGEPERMLFARLSVFRGGCRIDAAEAVCDPDGGLGIDILDGLANLVEQNLLRRRDDPDGEPRFWMLETIREYAGSTVDEPATLELRARHAAFFADLAERGRVSLAQTSPQALARLDLDLPNLRAALEHASEHERSLLASLADALSHYWFLRALYDEADRWLGDALRATDDHRLQEELLRWLAWSALVRGDYATATKQSEQRLNLARQSGDRRRIGPAASAHATASYYFTKDFEATRRLFEEAITLARERNDPTMLMTALGNYATVLEREGDLDAAWQFTEEVLNIARASGDAGHLSNALLNYGWLAHSRGDIDAAASAAEEALRLAESISWREITPHCLHALGAIRVAQGDLEAGVTLIAAGETLREELGTALDDFEQKRLQHAIRAAQTKLGGEQFQDAWQRGAKEVRPIESSPPART